VFEEVCVRSVWACVDEHIIKHTALNTHPIYEITSHAKGQSLTCALRNAEKKGRCGLVGTDAARSPFRNSADCEPETAITARWGTGASEGVVRVSARTTVAV
jgi:hypothetical protein